MCSGTVVARGAMRSWQVSARVAAWLKWSILARDSDRARGQAAARADANRGVRAPSGHHRRPLRASPGTCQASARGTGDPAATRRPARAKNPARSADPVGSRSGHAAARRFGRRRRRWPGAGGAAGGRPGDRPAARVGAWSADHASLGGRRDAAERPRPWDCRVDAQAAHLAAGRAAGRAFRSQAALRGLTRSGSWPGHRVHRAGRGPAGSLRLCDRRRSRANGAGGRDHLPRIARR